MFRLVQGKYQISCLSSGLPNLYEEYKKNAVYVDEIDIRSDDGENCFVAVGEGNGWPYVVVAQRYFPSSKSGFYPLVLIVPENELLFVGAGERITLYDLNKKAKVWEDTADTGFWGWARYKDFIIMTAELEFAVFSDSGRKLWTTFVEPPWGYEISGDQVELNVMGKLSRLSIATGQGF